MKPTVLWIVGEPGVGKSTLTRAILDLYGPVTNLLTDPKWTWVGTQASAPGHFHGGKFDGTDTLPISQIKTAVEFLRSSISRELCVIDGDKLSTQAAVEAVVESQARPMCVLLIGDGLAAERRIERGTDQDKSWIKGRRTKASNFWDKFPGKKMMLSPVLRPGEVADVVMEWVRK